MSYHRSKVDLLWNDSGDFNIDPIRKDIADTVSINYRALIQQITTRVQSSSGDWRLQPSLGANINKYVGKPNSQELGIAIKNSVTNSLISHGFLRASELQIEVFPIAEREIAILILVQPSGDRNQIRLAFSYNSQDNKIVPRNL